MREWIAICDCTELAVEIIRDSAGRSFAIEPRVETLEKDAFLEERLSSKKALAYAFVEAPSLSQLTQIVELSRCLKVPSVVAVLAVEDAGTRELMRNMGLITVSSLEALLSTLALLSLPVDLGWSASTRRLSKADRLRMPVLIEGLVSERQGEWLRHDVAWIAWRARASEPPIAIGGIEPVAQAVDALQMAYAMAQPLSTKIAAFEQDTIDAQAVEKIIFGPKRLLSDPSSKRVLVACGLPVPKEEMCQSASRAAVEASTLGFPVRVTLASPDLRIWNRPEFQAAGVSTASAVKEVYRQMMVLAEKTASEARILGVIVSQDVPCRALLQLQYAQVSDGWQRIDIAFADPHGMAAQDSVSVLFPIQSAAMLQILRRLRGVALLAAGPVSDEALMPLVRVILRTATLAAQHRQSIATIELRPVALLADGNIEVREACIGVSEAFQKAIEQEQ